MKKVNIEVNVTYTVAISEVEVSDNIYKGLRKTFEKIGILENTNKELSETFEWLSDNTQESDAHRWDYQINLFEELEDEK
jgi:hypothetical protein